MQANTVLLRSAGKRRGWERWGCVGACVYGGVGGEGRKVRGQGFGRGERETKGENTKLNKIKSPPFLK